MSNRRAPRDPASSTAGTSRIILVHDGTVRAVTISPWVAAVAAAALALLVLGIFAATAYRLFGDEALAALAAREARVQQAYEDRIAALRSQIDRITSRQLLDQLAFEDKIGTLMQRQASLESRQGQVAALLDQAGRSAGVAKPEPGAKEATAPGSLPPFRAGALRAPSAVEREAAERRLVGLVAGVDQGLARMEGEQEAALEQVELRSEQAVRRLRKALADLGVRAPEGGIASGGPFVPLDRKALDAFQSKLLRLRNTLASLEALNSTVAKLPLRRPVAGAAIVTSGYGPRIDPFLGRPALHTGLDFRAPYGQKVLATAPGRVVAAGHVGGYGNMVEVDHGDGYATRYAHLSAVLVREGDAVRTGTPIGRLGSTGRSTGPHLHYETRVNGEPEDPTRWLAAGARLGPLLPR